MIEIQKKFIKFFLVTVSCLLGFSIWGSQSNEEVVDEVRLLRFENRCMSEETANTQFCLKEYEVISQYIEGEETSLTVSSSTCHNSIETIERIIRLDNDFKDVQSELSCNEEDIEAVKQSCGKQFSCNMGRSVVTLVDSLAPQFLASKVKNGLSSLLSPEEGSSCLDEDQPDCLSEVYRSFVGSLVATATSFREIGKMTVGAFSSLKSYLFDKSEDLHKAAETTQEEAISFMDSPGKYILEKLTKFKNSVDTWIKDTVFCQKWEEDPETKVTTCAEPLRGYSCLDCNDGVNAFCAGAGFLLSEGLITVATAGTLTGVGILARAGAQAGSKYLARGAAALAERVPALSKLSRNSKNTATAARKANLISIAKTKISHFTTYLKNSRLGRGVAKTNEVATLPLRLVDDLTQKTIERVLSGATRVGGRTSLGKSIRITAKSDLRAMRLAQRGSDNVVSAAGTTSKGLLGNKVVRLGNRHRTTNRPSGHDRSRDPQRERTAERTPERERRVETDRERVEREKIEREKREREAERREENNEEHDGSTPSLVTGATKAIVAGDLASKSFRSLSDSFDEELFPSKEVIDSQISGEDQELDESKSLLENIEERTGKSFSSESEAKTFSQNMNRIYQDPNRKREVVRKMMDSRGLTRDQAESVYDSEKQFYAETQRKIQERQTRTSRLSDEVKNLKREIKIKDLVSKVRELKGQIDAPEKTIDVLEENFTTPTPSPEKVGADPRNVAPSGQPESTMRNSSRIPTSFGGSSPLQDFGDQEETVADIEKGEEKVEASEKSPETKTEPKTEEEKRLSNANLKTMDFFSLFLAQIEQNGLSFRTLSKEETDMVTPLLEENPDRAELDHLKVATIEEEDQKFLIFYDEKNQRTLVLNNEGQHLSQIPIDLI